MTGRHGRLRPRRLVGAAAFVLGALVALPAAADERNDGAGYRDNTDEVRFDDEFDENEYQVVGRIRTVGIPKFVLDAFWDRHSGNWTGGQANLGYGVEFVWRKVDAFEMSIAGEYANLRMPGDWWLQKGDPNSAAEYTEFELGLASLVFSGYWYWDVTQWFSPYVGGGVGLGLVLGEVTNFDPNTDSACHNELGASGGGGFGGERCFREGGEPDTAQMNREIEDEIWPVAPVVNVTTGARFNIGEHGVAKLEFGFYDYLYAGLSVGGQW